MRVFSIVFIIIMLMVGVVAFTSEQVFSDPHQRATERAVLSQTVAYGQTQVPTIQALQLTVDSVTALETQAAQVVIDMDNILATQVAITQTPASFIPTPPPPTTAFTANAETRFTDTAIAAGIDESNGCATDLRQNFTITGSNDSTQIYLTTIGRNLRAGTVIQTRWYPENDRANAFESVSWTPTINHEQVCIYFWLESSNIPYSSGMWMAELVVDGAVQDSLSFMMCEVDEAC